MKPIGWIYLTTNLVNGKIYVGKHEILENKKLNATYIGSGRLFKRALKKYGEENFKRKILRLCYTLHELRIWEHVYIVKYKSYVRSIGYNIAKGDVNTSEYNPAKLPEVRKKMSESATIRCSTEEYKKSVSDRMKGKKHNEDFKRKVSLKLKGRILTEEHKKKISDSNKGKKKSKEAVQKMRKSLIEKGYKHTEEWGKIHSEMMSGANHPMFGKHLTEETKQRISKKLRGKKATEETKRKLSESRKKEKHWNFGKHWNEEVKKKISDANRGKKRNDEQKKFMSCRMKGKNNPMYGTRFLWINNGVKNKRHNIGEEIPNGWNIGFIVH